MELQIKIEAFHLIANTLGALAVVALCVAACFFTVARATK